MALVTVPNASGLILLGLTPIVPQQVNRSEWTSRTQVVGMPGAETWAIRAALAPMASEADERPWRAFLFSLRGRQNHFHYPLACQQHVGGKPLVNAASSSGYSLPLDGMTPSVTILPAGSFLTVPLPSGHRRTVMLEADLVTNGAGQATAQFNFALGEVPADNAEVESLNPYIPVRSADGGIGLTYDNAVSGAALNLEESL